METNLRLEKLTSAFTDLFGSANCGLFRAPGRVNLIGEHTDYNEGFVLPMAIELDVIAAARRRNDRIVRSHSLNCGDGAEFSMDSVERNRARHWSDYVRGVTLYLVRRFPELKGIDMAVHGTVPVGSGLSSSAAIEIATAIALLELNGLSMDRVDVARLCQKAENEFVGARCGLMDQLTSVCAPAGKVLFLDCRTLGFEPISIPKSVTVVICDTKKRRELSSSKYNERRMECEAAVRILRRALPAVTALRDVTPDVFEKNSDTLPAPLNHRVEHVVRENRRVQECAAALRAGDVTTMGELMEASHRSLKELFEVSSPELETMVRIAKETDGCFGARMTGAGFGGCTVNIVQSERLLEFEKTVKLRYERETGASPDVYVTQAAEGAGPVRSEV